MSQGRGPSVSRAECHHPRHAGGRRLGLRGQADCGPSTNTVIPSEARNLAPVVCPAMRLSSMRFLASLGMTELLLESLSRRQTMPKHPGPSGEFKKDVKSWERTILSHLESTKASKKRTQNELKTTRKPCYFDAKIGQTEPWAIRVGAAGGAYVTTRFVVMYAPLLSEWGRDMPKSGTSAPPATQLNRARFPASLGMTELLLGSLSQRQTMPKHPGPSGAFKKDVKSWERTILSHLESTKASKKRTQNELKMTRKRCNFNAKIGQTEPSAMRVRAAGGGYVTTRFVVTHAPLLSERGRDMPKNGTSAPPATQLSRARFLASLGMTELSLESPSRACHAKKPESSDPCCWPGPWPPPLHAKPTYRG